MLCKIRTIDGFFMQEKYLEMDKKKGQPNRFKQRNKQGTSKEENKWKGKGRNTTTTIHQCKDLDDHGNHCTIDVHTKDKFWMLHLELNPKNHKEPKKKNMLVDLGNQVECNIFMKQRWM